MFSVDLDESSNSTLEADVLSLQPEQLPPIVDLIWAASQKLCDEIAAFAFDRRLKKKGVSK